MKRLFLFALILGALMLACNIPQPETPAPATGGPPAASETPQLPSTPTVAETPPIVANVQCNELSFYLDPAVAVHAGCETVPENLENDPFQLPQHTRVTLTGYVLPDQPLFQRIHVYRLADFLAVQPRLSGRADEMKALIAGGAPGPKALPVLDLFGAAQVFHSHYKVVPFANGSGYRFVTMYSQACPPISSEGIFILYQGLTSDEQYFISAVLRTSNPILQAGPEPIPGGMDQGEFCNQYLTYAADIAVQLDAQSEASFMPSLTLLDALLQSIVIAA